MRYELRNLAEVVAGKLIGDNNTVTNVMTDSRSVSSCNDTLFVAIKGVNHDGHNYISTMYERGVRSFIVEREVSGNYPSAGFIVVNNSVEALQLWAAHYRSQFKGTMVAITGSNGKTVVKEWIAQLCPDHIKMFRSPKSYNSQIGVPLSLLMMRGDEQIAIIEAGISQRSEMERLEKIIAPDTVIFTNIGEAHQANFISKEEKLYEKLLLCQNTKTLIYNGEQRRLIEAIERDFSDRRLIKVTSSSYSMPLPVNDTISRMNANQAVALYESLGIDTTEIQNNVATLQPVIMRMELKDGIHNTLIINDSYNSDINSISPALDFLCSTAGSRKKICILSDIMQSGGSAHSLYQQVATLITQKGIDLFIGIGRNICENRSAFDCPSQFYKTTEQFLHQFDMNGIDNACILIKGGRSFEFEKISRILELKVHTTTLEVNIDAMIHNLNYFRSLVKPEVKVIGMVKALSYGNGTFEIARMLQSQGVGLLAVAFADEGVTLRNEGITMPIVVLNADSDSFSTMIEYDLEPEIYSFQSLLSFSEAVRRHGGIEYPVHIKLDTGMHRLGFIENDIDPLIEKLKNNRTVKVVSIFSHFAVSDEPDGKQFTQQQISSFERMSNRIIQSMPYTGILRHICNSAAIEKYPEAQFDAVRLGIGLYGISVEHQSHMHNVSTLKSRIVQIKTLEAGETVGYGRHGHIESVQRIATIPIGYADGLDRRLGRGNWSMMVGNKLAPTIGNICMDTCMIDITGIDAVEGDEVTIFGAEPSIIQMAKLLDTIPYEIMTSISTRVKRIFIKE